MHALEKLGDGRKDKGYENGESKGDQDDASEIESANHDDGYDHAEESRQVFVSGVTGHYIWPSSPVPKALRECALTGSGTKHFRAAMELAYRKGAKRTIQGSIDEMAEEEPRANATRIAEAGFPVDAQLSANSRADLTPRK
jgi:hypothetical protein